MKLRLSLLAIASLAFSISFAQIKLEDLKVDTTITGFHFAIDFQGTMVFTKNGPPDIEGTINPSAFSFTIVKSASTFAKTKLEELLMMSQQGGLKITDLIRKDTTIKGNDAYYISYTETDDKSNYKNIVFNAFVIKDGTVILFTSGDLDRGIYTEKYKKTFYSIKL